MTKLNFFSILIIIFLINNNCNSFKVENTYNHIIANTYGNIIHVKAEGVGSDVVGSNLAIQDVVGEINNNYGGSTVEILDNSSLEIIIPAGDGPKNYSIQAFFLDFNNNHTFYYMYEKPIIKSFSFLKSGDEISELTIEGTGFSYVNENNITINGLAYNATRARSGKITVSNNNTKIYLENGSKFEISINVSGQQSKSEIFYLYESLEIKSIIPKLYLDGGLLILEGSFTTKSSNLLNVTINNIDCEIESVNGTTLIINYPSVDKKGEYVLNISFGTSYLLSTNVEYLEQSEIDDNPSNSSIISTSIFLLLSLLFIQFLI